MTKTNMMVKVQEELNVGEQELEMILNKLDMDIDELSVAISDSEYRIFDTYKELFLWVHEGSSEDSLIEMLFEGTTGLVEDGYYIFSDGRALFVYK